jgi:DAK2 domain fusion protein YloV
VTFLAGALGYLSGEEVPLKIATPEGGVGSVAVSQEFLEHTEEEMYGFCTQFVVSGEGLDVDDVRERVMAMAGSTVVIGDDRTVRIHAHAEDPGPLLSLGVSLGTVEHINIQNMDVQHQQFLARHGYAQAEQRSFAIVAVAPGDGIARVFKEQGAAQVVNGGQTMNPSIAQLLEAVRHAGGDHTVVLPNNSNIVMAATQAAQIADRPVSVVPSLNIAQGIAALMAYNPDLDAQANVDAMTSAIASVRFGEVTVAVRSTQLDGMHVSKGQAIALLDDTLVTATPAPAEALLAMLSKAAPEEGSLVTLYYGKDVTETQAHAVAEEIAERCPGVETEVVNGGQPHYHYLVSIE